MTSPSSPTHTADLWRARWQRFAAAALHAFHVYGNWLVGISWRRFIVLSVGLMIVVGILHDTPLFTWTLTEKVDNPSRVIVMPRARRSTAAPVSPKSPESPSRTDTSGKDEGVDISIGKEGIRIVSKPKATEAGASAAAPGSLAASASADGIEIKLPPGINTDAVREAVKEARRQIEETIQDAKRDAQRDLEEARRDAEEARRDAETALEELTREQDSVRSGTRRVRGGPGPYMPQLALLWIAASAILKYTYKGRMQAEVKAAQATETAEAESLKRQVVEARMAAMQAQIEPHFLFNTLASIDHLIETDPARASVMQKNLIALLRASMPTMREASGNGSNGSGVRDLGRELAVIRPYLEILKVRMEERLTTEIVVPEGLLSAEFPPMMIQTLVENAIKHGLEPKAEGGMLKLVAEIVHGKLQVTVADTGLGFGKAATAGTGVGLANIRERLQLLYGPKATLTVAANQPSGTTVTITVPYKTVEGTHA